MEQSLHSILHHTPVKFLLWSDQRWSGILFFKITEVLLTYILRKKCALSAIWWRLIHNYPRCKKVLTKDIQLFEPWLLNTCSHILKGWKFKYLYTIHRMGMLSGPQYVLIRPLVTASLQDCLRTNMLVTLGLLLKCSRISEKKLQQHSLIKNGK